MVMIVALSQRENDENPWQQTSGAPITRGDDFTIEEEALDGFLAGHGLRRSSQPAQAGDVLFFSSMTANEERDSRTAVGPRVRGASD